MTKSPERQFEESLNPSDPVALTSERHNQHGDWVKQSALAFDLKERVRMEVYDGSHCKLRSYQLEAIESILTKISRACCGDPNLEDHWDDIAGYAHLGKGGHTG